MKALLLFLTILILPLSSFADDIMKNNALDIAKHYAAQPSLYALDTIEKEKLSDKITRQYILGSQSTFVKWTLKKGALIPLHFHPNEQITWITQGSVKVTSQGKDYTVKAGEVFVIPANVPHEFLALEDTIDIDFFTPVRQDWLNNTASYIQAIQKK
jgi:quercetin dioxygenase-like cupin family protein